MAEPVGGGRPDALAITGATATGKTALALEVAARLDGEVVSADSRQVYRGMDIGTAKATAAERAAVPHHGLDLISPAERYSAGRFAREARGWVAGIRARGRVPLLVGGTGFFLRALTHPLFREPALEAERRRALERWLRPLSDAKLLAWLRALDPATASVLERGGGRQRRLRALEVALLSGRPLSWWHAHAPAPEQPLDLLVFVLEMPREALYRRIDARVDAMLEAGLVEEVRRVVAAWGEGAPGMSATGYAELAPYLRGETSLAVAADMVRRATRRYARRQQTWLRHQLPAGAVRLDATRSVAELADDIAARWRREEAS